MDNNTPVDYKAMYEQLYAAISEAPCILMQAQAACDFQRHRAGELSNPDVSNQMYQQMLQFVDVLAERGFERHTNP